MMLRLDETLEPGIRRTYTLDNERSAPLDQANAPYPGRKERFSYP